MKKQNLVTLVTFSLIISWILEIVPAHGQSSQPQFFGIKFRNSNGKGYWGVDGLMTTPSDLPVASGDFINAPVAVSNAASKSTLTYIESGPIKDCTSRGDCKLRAYSAWRAPGMMTAVNIYFRYTLPPGNIYRYKSEYDYRSSGTSWNAFFCYGTQCDPVTSTQKPVNLTVNNLPYVAAGGESSRFGVTWGTVTASNMQNRPADYTGTNLFSWCYDTPPSGIINSVGSKGSITTCDPANYSWTVRYAP
jgi:hypothetical protein